ncbi:Oxygen oxidoreductase covalent FAD-binding site [Sesbania bispinosa]|nr:Oxygen oxidoreductase covalent FAD-binding site [Sesbania bispinosa]
MALSYFTLSKALILLWLTTIVLITQARFQPWSALDAPREIIQNLIRDPVTISLASTDFGHIVHQNPFAIFAPSSINDISKLIKFSNSVPTPFSIAARGQGHSVHGQAMTHDGVVVNMTELNNGFRNGSGILVVSDPLRGNNYADVGGEQIWIDVLHACLQSGLTPLSWTDYLYLSVGGTLSNAGISGQTFRFGPQISNVHELDVVTGNGNVVTCSAEKNSELFYGVLGGLGQFGIITRARIALGPAPKRANYVEGMLLLNQPPLDLSFYPTPDQPRITSLVTQHSMIYVIELVKYYDDNSQDLVDQEIEVLVQGLKFVPTFMLKKDVSYEEFLNRVHSDELVLRSKGLWDVPHPWLNLFVPGSRISDFSDGVFKGIILKQNISTGLVLVYPMNRTKWDDKMSAVTPDEQVFYIVSFLHTTGFDKLEAFQAQNQQILQFCADAGIGIKQYLPQNKTKEEWVQHFGPKWKAFQDRKLQFDPNKILSPGQGIFN